MNFITIFVKCDHLNIYSKHELNLLQTMGIFEHVKCKIHPQHQGPLRPIWS